MNRFMKKTTNIVQTPGNTLIFSGTDAARQAPEEAVHCCWMVRTRKAYVIGERTIAVSGLRSMKKQLRRDELVRREFIRALCELKTAQPVSLHMNGRKVFDLANRPN